MVDIQDVSIKAMWCDRLRPRTFDECLMHSQLNEKMQALTVDAKARNELPHLLITGPAGSGKRTRASCLIASLYRIRRSELYKIYKFLPNQSDETNVFAPNLEEVLDRINFTVIDGIEYSLTQEEQRCDDVAIPVNIVLTRAKTITCDKAKDGIQVLHSPVHVEMTPHDVNYCDTKIIQTTLKTLFENNEFDLLTFGAIPSLSRFHAAEPTSRAATATVSASTEHVNPRFRVFVFNNVDKMSREAQTALRRIMEDYSSTVRFILIAVNVDHICAPIQSRCHLVTLKRPSDETIQTVLKSALYRVLTQEIRQSVAYQKAVEPYLRMLVKQCDGNVTKALTVLQASVQSVMTNESALVNSLRQFDIAQPDWIASMNECVTQICQVNMRSNSGRHVFIKDTLGELLKRRVPTEYVVRFLDKNVRRTLIEQCNVVTNSIDQLLQETVSDCEDRISDEERQFLEKKLDVIKCQLAGVCSDITTACAFYETRSTQSQYSIIHVNALALCLVVIVGLYQNSLAITLDAEAKMRVCRPYSSVFELSRLLRHTMQKNDHVVPKIAEQQQTTVNTAEKMKQLCICNSLIDWKLVRQRAATEQKLDIEKILINN